MQTDLQATLRALASVALTLFVCHGSAFGKSTQQQQEIADHLSVTFYNTLNLFDTEHDEGKDDWTFLPKSFPGKMDACRKISSPYYRQQCFDTDWTPEHLALKVKQLSKVVRDRQSDTPDLLGLAEVENQRAVAALASALGYQHFIVSDSPDKRGIDVALVYKTDHLNFVRKQEHVIPINEVNKKPTRNILEVEFRTEKGNRLIVFTNHWPSQAAPAAVRFEVAQRLKDVIDARMTEDPDVHILAMGDFNVIKTDYPHPFEQLLTMKDGGNQLLWDVHDLFWSDRGVSMVQKRKTPMGTYFYPPQMTWNRLDRFLVNKKLRLSSGLKADASSYRIHLPQAAVENFVYDDPEHFLYNTVITGVPIPGDTTTLNEDQVGFSDHYSIRMNIRLD